MFKRSEWHTRTNNLSTCTEVSRLSFMPEIWRDENRPADWETPDVVKIWKQLNALFLSKMLFSALQNVGKLYRISLVTICMARISFWRREGSHSRIWIGRNALRCISNLEHFCETAQSNIQFSGLELDVLVERASLLRRFHAIVIEIDLHWQREITKRYTWSQPTNVSKEEYHWNYGTKSAVLK